MLNQLLLIASTILSLVYKGAQPSAYSADTHRATSAAHDCMRALDRFPHVSKETKDVLASIAYAFSAFEGNWYANPKGDNDKGQACGVMQTHTPERFVKGATCEKVRADRALSYQVGMTIILERWKTCGTLEAGLTAYGTKNGDCKTYVLPLVKRRCELANVDCKARIVPIVP